MVGYISGVHVIWQALPFKKERQCTCKTGQMDVSPPTSPRGRTDRAPPEYTLWSARVKSKAAPGVSPGYFLLAFLQLSSQIWLHPIETGNESARDWICICHSLSVTFIFYIKKNKFSGLNCCHQNSTFSSIFGFCFLKNMDYLASQCFVIFCCTVKWISCMYTYIPSLLDFLPI